MRKIVLSIFAVLMLCFQAEAQNQRVTGTVTDPDGKAIVGVTVRVQGTSIGASTVAGGKYSISAPADAVLEFSFIGMAAGQVHIAGQTVVNYQFESDTSMIDNVVVTAMGITKSEKSLGYSATTLKSNDLTSSRNTNPISSVAGKVAGVQISNSSTQAGAANSVIIRGVSSIGNSNQPLYVIDGVPMQNISYKASEYSSMGTGIGSVNPDDIEALTVLKGAAATALYGSRAAGGVILITTKNGQLKQKSSVTINAGVQFSNVAYLPEMHNEFGTGWDGSFTLNENGSWGPRFNNQLRAYGPVVNNSQMIKRYAAIPNNIRNFYDTGVQYSASAAVSGGNDKTSYYLSYSNVTDNGIMPRDKDTYKKNTLSFRGSNMVYDWLDVASSVNFTTQKTDAVIIDNGASIMEGLYQSGRDISFIDMQDLSSIFNNPEGYFTPYGITNPYWLIDNSYNRINAKKVFGKIQANITPIENLTLTYRFGFDYADSDSKRTVSQISMDSSYENASSTNQEGSVYAGYNRRYELNHDFLANYDIKFGKFDLNATVGANANERYSTSTGVKVSGLTFNTGFWDLSNTSNHPNATEEQLKRRSVSAFADVQLGWADQLYLNATARNDWSSTLPVESNSFFYPGATLSWLFSNTFPAIHKVVSFGKLRLAYGQTGADPNVYLTNPVYIQGTATSYYGASTDMTFPFNGYNAYMATGTLASPTLQPEITTEFEVGANIQFLNGRIGLDIAYYNRVSDMQIFTLPVDPATGYSQMVVNFGQVSNKGVELLLNTTPLKLNNFRWDVDFNFAKNNNLVKSLPDGLDGGRSQILSYSGTFMYAEVGKPIGTLWTTMPIYNEKGQIQVNSDGLPMQTTDAAYSGYNVQPDWTGGIHTSLTYKNLSISATLDVRHGGKMFSRTKSILWFAGNSKATTYNDRNAFIIPNSVYEDGTENTTPISLYSSTYQYFFNGNKSFPLEGGMSQWVDRSYAKLRELSISYNLPKKWISRLGVEETRVSLVGNNLFLWTPKSNCYIDPDQGYTTDLLGMFGEIASTVPCRYMGFNIQVRF